MERGWDDLSLIRLVYVPKATLPPKSFHDVNSPQSVHDHVSSPLDTLITPSSFLASFVPPHLTESTEAVLAGPTSARDIPSAAIHNIATARHAIPLPLPMIVLILNSWAFIERVLTHINICPVPAWGSGARDNTRTSIDASVTNFDPVINDD
ncbi:hypothetical protein TWF106_001694 [Orbilia oligospora]|uniref:Uncharacterized protein n=1 Tax=Orbilia oligospora TaxID=2813651 RepID=A0A7C8UYK7_ORBOL|nr:hypothetical protein TWF106_001694 [Orbilia oligospora]